MTIPCRYIEEEKLVAVEVTLPDGTTRHLVLPATEWGKKTAKEFVAAVNSREALLNAAKLGLKAYLRLPIGPDIEAIVMPEMEDLEEAITQAEVLNGK